MIVFRGKMNGTKLWLNEGEPFSQAIEKYVFSGDSAKHSASDLLDSNNRMNRIYIVDVPDAGRIIQKETSVTGKYGFFRRLEKNFKVLFTKRGLVSMRMALRVASAGVRTIRPLAYWISGGRNSSRVCGFAYMYVPGETFESIWRRGKYTEENAPAVERRIRQLGATAKKLHDAGLRHLDMDPRNLILTEGSVEMTLIDIDSVSAARIHLRRFKRAADMCSLRRVAMKLNDNERRIFCEAYAGGDGVDAVNRAEKAMAFWHSRSRGRLRHRIRALLCSDF